MILHQNWVIFASVIFFLATVIVSYFAKLFKAISMYTKRDGRLTSIPERNENEDQSSTKWVPKKKHEVLKAKYKCLKKLFQIYDASMIGLQPELENEGDNLTEVTHSPVTVRKRRSHRTKTDACAGTSDISSEISLKTESHHATGDLHDNDHEISEKSSTKINDRTVSNSTVTLRECEFTQTSEPPIHPIPYLYYNEKPRLTKFQSFLHRILGIRRYRPMVLPNGHVFAASDNNIVHNYGSKRRRRRIRFRRRRLKNVQSEGMLLDAKRPILLNYVQSVQKNCLLDMTPRQCPILGCRMICYGIINYNDHLNLCHFTDRKHICRYCHEGFEREQDKLIHENEHLGIPKLNLNSPTSTYKRVINTQTEPNSLASVPEEKLKKIVSFFDRIVDSERAFSQKEDYVESNSAKTESESNDSTKSSNSEDKSICSVRQCHKSKSNSTRNTDLLENEVIKCHICGEIFDCRRQLSLHVDLEHRVHNKFSKFHSCAGIINSNRKGMDCLSEDGAIKVQSVEQSNSDFGRIDMMSSVTELSSGKSKKTLSYDPSTNIVYYQSSSLESVSKNESVLKNFDDKVKGGIKRCNYKWEPGTKIIHV